MNHLAIFSASAGAGALYMNQALAPKEGEPAKDAIPAAHRLAVGALTGTLLCGVVYLALTVYSQEGLRR